MKCSFHYLFSRGTIGMLAIKNRLVMPAVGTGLATEDGAVTEDYMTFYEVRAKGGAGLIFTESAMVNAANGRSHHWQLGAYDDKFIPGLKTLTRRIHKHGAKIFLQLSHPGGQTYAWSGETLMTPSGIANKLKLPVREITIAEIHSITRDFADAALRAKKAGMDGVEINAAHGYLLSDFLSPCMNKRTDEYGRDMIGRCRFVKEIIEAIREKVGQDFPLCIRVTADEYLMGQDILEKGMILSDCIAILNYLIPHGIDAVSVSSGNYESQNTAWEPISFPQGWRAYLAETIKQNVPIPVIGVSVIREPEYAESLLKRGALDFVGVARGQIADPEWGMKAEEGRPMEIRRCISCLHCMEMLQKSGRSECAINPRSHHEAKLGGIKESGNNRPAVIIGGGPAGMEAARILALRGFKPILFEKSTRLGGQLHLANKPPFKGKIDWLMSYFEERLRVLNVDIRLGTEATVPLIKAENPVAVFIATGSLPNMPPSIVGIDGPNVYKAVDVLSGKVKFIGKQIIVVGDGQTGVETAEFLGRFENVVSIVGKGSKIGEKIYVQSRTDGLRRLVWQHARFFPHKQLVAINPYGITVQNMVTKDLSFMPTDAVVLALGVRPDTGSHSAILKAFPNAVLLGDAIRGGRIADAVRTAHEAVVAVE